jgi:hypothetical protein
MLKNYREQFRAIQRDENQNGSNPNLKTKPNDKSGSIAVRPPPPSDTMVSPPKQPGVNSTSSFSEKKRSETMRGNDTTRPAQKYCSSSFDQQDVTRKPIRYTNKQKNAYPPAFHPSRQDSLNRSRVIRVANNEYAERRRNGHSIEQLTPDENYSEEQNLVNKKRQKLNSNSFFPSRIIHPCNHRII